MRKYPHIKAYCSLLVCSVLFGGQISSLIRLHLPDKRDSSQSVHTDRQNRNKITSKNRNFYRRVATSIRIRSKNVTFLTFIVMHKEFTVILSTWIWAGIRKRKESELPCLRETFLKYLQGFQGICLIRAKFQNLDSAEYPEATDKLKYERATKWMNLMWNMGVFA